LKPTNFVTQQRVAGSVQAILVSGILAIRSLTAWHLIA